MTLADLAAQVVVSHGVSRVSFPWTIRCSRRRTSAALDASPRWGWPNVCFEEVTEPHLNQD